MFLRLGEQKNLNENQQVEISRTEWTKKNFADLNNIFKKCKRIIEAEEGIRSDISFKEISKIILSKIFEEKRGTNGEVNRFSVDYLRKKGSVLEAFEEIFDEAKSVYPIYDESKEKVRINFSHEENLLRIVGLLQDWSFSRIDEDLKGMLYEIFLRASLRGELGQFFTPKELVSFMISMVNLSEKQKILDPACGSGGFLIHSFLRIKDYLIKSHNLSNHFNDALTDFVKNGLWGFEIDADLHLLAKINLIMHGDGFEHIYNGDFLSYNEEVNCKFDVILTNPPFSLPVENKVILNNYQLGKHKNSEQIDILYVEKCLKLLKEDGMLAIVLPEGLLNLPSYQYFREFILAQSEILANISIPAGAFLPFGQSNCKTCILFLKKKGKMTIESVFMADAKEIGFEIGRKNYVRHKRNDLPSFISHFRSQIKQINSTEWGGRSTFVDQFLLDSKRLDSKYYFMKLYVDHLKNSGAQFVKLSEVAIVAQPRIVPSKNPEAEFYYLEIPDISEGTGTIGNIRMLKGRQIKGIKVRFKSGDILFCRMYPSKNRIVIAPEEIKEGVCSNEIYTIRPINPKEIDPYVLLATLKSSIVSNQVKDLIAGSSSSRPRLNDKLLRDVLIPVLTREENERIAKRMKEVLVDYWNSSQKYLQGYKEVMAHFGDDIKTQLLRKV